VTRTTPARRAIPTRGYTVPPSLAKEGAHQARSHFSPRVVARKSRNAAHFQAVAHSTRARALNPHLLDRGRHLAQ
jgi:hypothetical protein